MAKFDVDKSKQKKLGLEDTRLCTIIDTEGNKIKTYMFWDREISVDELLVVTKGFDGCLFIFDETSYEKFIKCLTELPKKKPEARMLGRFFVAGAIDTEFNEEKQLALPHNLIVHARIGTEAVIEGDRGFATIWSIDEWQKGHFPNGILDIEKRIAEY